MRSGNGNLHHLKCILQCFEINNFFPLDSFTDGCTIKTTFFYHYVHRYQFLVKYAVVMWNKLLFAHCILYSDCICALILYSDYMFIIALFSPMFYNLRSLQGHRSSSLYFIFIDTFIERTFRFLWNFLVVCNRNNYWKHSPAMVV